MVHTRIDGYLIHFTSTTISKSFFSQFIYNLLHWHTFHLFPFDLIFLWWDNPFQTQRLTVIVTRCWNRANNNWNVRQRHKKIFQTIWPYYQHSVTSSSWNLIFVSSLRSHSIILDANCYISLSLESTFHSLIVTPLKLMNNNQWEKVMSKGRIDVKYSS